MTSYPKRAREPQEQPASSRPLKKKRQVILPCEGYYRECPGDTQVESYTLVLAGEDEEDDEDGDKPVRVLECFTIFDPRDGNKMISLGAMEEDDGVDREFEGAGVALPCFLNGDGEEEGGGEDEDEDEDERWEGGTVVRLSAILRFWFDYMREGEPVWIETQFAWYKLGSPSKEYTPYFQQFYTPLRIAQLAISCMKTNPDLDYDQFEDHLVRTDDGFGQKYQVKQLSAAIPEIHHALEDMSDDPDFKSIQRRSPLLRHLLKNALPRRHRRKKSLRARCAQSAPSQPPVKKSLGGSSLDLAVLRPENQTPTHVTPLIAELARGMVLEELQVVGAPLPVPSVNQALLAEAAHARLCDLIRRAKERRGKPPVVDMPDERVDGYGEEDEDEDERYVKSVVIDGEIFRAGDFIVVEIGKIEGKRGESFGLDLPDDLEDVAAHHQVADYFWFAKILYGDTDKEQFHVQWLEHSSHTMLEELGHSQELFYNDLCDNVDFKFIVSKVVVHEIFDSSGIGPDEFFVKFTYDPKPHTFLSIDRQKRKWFSENSPPYNCLSCALKQEQQEKDSVRKVKDAEGNDGVAFGGQKYHLYDFVLYQSEDGMPDCGPARIGYITKFHFPPQNRRSSKDPTLTVRLVGRISLICDSVLPKEEVKDERHVYLTEQTATITLTNLIRTCFVFCPASFQSLGVEREEWLLRSPDHYYLTCTSPTLDVDTWDTLVLLGQNEMVKTCCLCVDEAKMEYCRMSDFLVHAERHPLPTLDLFGGVAAFSTGLNVGSRCLAVTDVIEKSPSAALTVKYNHPDVAVHNQCVNVMLRYDIRIKEGKTTEVPKQIFDESESIAGPVKPVKCIVAGFPCQSHSDLNMFKKANDIRSNLILNALSWIDHLRPDLCYFENVPGFLRFSFGSIQAGMHKVESAIDRGGLKFLVRALGDMGYQVRYGILQAAQFGTPQRRSRFFLVGAVDGHPLPEFPQPTHCFFDVKKDGVQAARKAPHATVTISDAISDLPRFDWKHPNLERENASEQQAIRQREEAVPTFECEPSSVTRHCGMSGKPEYHHEAKTRYQMQVRQIETQDIQHFTRCFAKQKVERVVCIPLNAKADYRDLRPDQQEWQTSGVDSAIGKAGYRAGPYARLDEHSCFPTTVTNMDPTAKQNKVLNPWCKRMVTVRELARSQGFPDHFVFKALDDNVITMHRQIGNAVPLPLGAALGRELRLALYKKWLQTR